MLSFRSSKRETEEVEEPKGFDAFELRLGDVMRGERATMGKSLLDVQRELRIKASYIAAIENCDPDAFDTAMKRRAHMLLLQRNGENAGGFQSSCFVRAPGTKTWTKTHTDSA